MTLFSAIMSILVTYLDHSGTEGALDGVSGGVINDMKKNIFGLHFSFFLSHICV